MNDCGYFPEEERCVFINETRDFCDAVASADHLFCQHIELESVGVTALMHILSQIAGQQCQTQCLESLRMKLILFC